MGKTTVWNSFGWRAHSFEVRTKAGFKVRGNTADLIQNRLYWFGIWEPAISTWVTQTLRSGDVFVDVGANIGYYTLLAARLVGDAGHVIAIEPAARIHDRLEGNLRINRVHNVSQVRVAVGSHRRRARLFHGPSENLGATSLLNLGINGAESEEVDVLPLSQILPRELLPRISLIKIDVEGAEADALTGLEAVMDRLPEHVAIVCEIDPARVAALGSSAHDTIGRMRQFGFAAYTIKNVYRASAYLALEMSRPKLIEGRLETRADVVFARSAGRDRERKAP